MTAEHGKPNNWIVRDWIEGTGSKEGVGPLGEAEQLIPLSGFPQDEFHPISSHYRRNGMQEIKDLS